jgi:hypothetical protein
VIGQGAVSLEIEDATLWIALKQSMKEALPAG